MQDTPATATTEPTLNQMRWAYFEQAARLEAEDVLEQGAADFGRMAQLAWGSQWAGRRAQGVAQAKVFQERFSQYIGRFIDLAYNATKAKQTAA